MKDTAAWKVIGEILTHTWGLDNDLDADTIISICGMFKKAGGSWKEVMDGDVRHISMLEDCIGNVIGMSKIARVALKVSRDSKVW